MNDVLKDVYEFRSLRARRDVFGARLNEGEVQRLASFQRLFAPPPVRLRAPSLGELADRREFARVPVDLRASVEVGPGLLEQVRVLNIGGGGLEVAPPTSLERGELTIVAVTDADSGHEYLLPAQVMWAAREAQGMCFVGVPA